LLGGEEWPVGGNTGGQRRRPPRLAMPAMGKLRQWLVVGDELRWSKRRL
jgi:hypothetical protein